ncbi:MAG: DASS family sodium-coupled anion symporter [Deltaproteobacteria bacterium]
MTAMEAISPAEQRFEAIRRVSGLAAGPLVFVFFYFIPTGLPEAAHRLLSVFALVMVFWLTEAIPLPATALLGAALNAALGVASAEVVFAPFANPIVFLFIGSFILAESITANGLDRRFAFSVFSIRFFQRSPLGVLAAMGAVSAIISMWVSNTATAAMMLPVGLGLLGTLKEAGVISDGRELKTYSSAMMLMLAYGASVGGIATPIGTPPNLIGIGMIEEFAGVRITFFEWMVFALPITAVMFGSLVFILGRGCRSAKKDISGINDYVRKSRQELGGWGMGEIYTAIAFLLAIALWVAPSAVAGFFGKGSAASRLLSGRLDEGVVAVSAAVLLFFLPTSVKGLKFAISWERALKIDWGTIILFGGGLSLGKLMFSTGLAKEFGGAITGVSGATSLWGVTAVGTVFAIIISETTSNTTSASMVIPIMVAIAKGAGIPPIPVALGACLGASFGFMLPVSTPPNAIVYGSGLVPILTMAKKGIVFDVVGFFIIMAGLMVMSPIMGWV